MGYRIEIESQPAGLRRIAVEQLGRAAEGLAGDGGPGERIHDARKRLKKTRSLLRLARDPLGDVRAAENDRLRELGRRLSDLRDADASREALEVVGIEGLLDARERERLERAFAERRRRIAGARSDLEERLIEMARELKQAADDATRWPLRDAGFDGLAPGFEHSYRRARRALRRVRRSPTDERLHEWRKRVKDHWYHVRLLRDVWKPVMKARATALASVSRHLGDDRDLVLLVGVLGELTPEIGAGPAASLLGAAGARRRELQSAALAGGVRLFAEKPRHLTRRVGRYWDAWQAEHSAVASAVTA